jgi:hypothetical protein
LTKTFGGVCPSPSALNVVDKSRLSEKKICIFLRDNMLSIAIPLFNTEMRIVTKTLKLGKSACALEQNDGCF